MEVESYKCKCSSKLPSWVLTLFTIVLNIDLLNEKHYDKVAVIVYKNISQITGVLFFVVVRFEKVLTSAEFYCFECVAKHIIIKVFLLNPNNHNQLSSWDPALTKLSPPQPSTK